MNEMEDTSTTNILRSHNTTTTTTNTTGPSSSGEGVGNTTFRISLPNVSRWVLLILIVFYMLGLISNHFVHLFAMVPSNFIPGTWLWLILTSGFYHTRQNYIELLLNIAVIVVVLPPLEILWGTRETLKYILIVSTVCALLTFLVHVVFYYITGIYAYLFDPVGGFYGCSMALLVALKQLYPEEEWKYHTFSIRAKHLPFVFLILSIILYYFFSPVGSVTAINGIGGLVVSWVYLTFFQYKNSEQGDPNFKFSSLFPEILQPPVELASKLLCVCFPKKKAIGLQTDFKYSVLDSPEDAERRRQLALKVLDDKFQNMSMKDVSIIEIPPDSEAETKE